MNSLRNIDTKLQIDVSYFGLGPVEAEIWPGESEGLVQGKMGKSEGRNE